MQLQGEAGRVVATDARQALAWGGFEFPFAESVLVPALPVFGASELRRETVRVGRSARQVVLSAGPWTLALAIDPSGRFPDAVSVVPQSQTPTVVVLGESDARFVLGRLDKASAGKSSTGVTLDAGEGRAALRFAGVNGEPPTELALPSSRASGPAVRVVLDRRHLTRGLTLGFRTVRLCGGNRPAAMTDRERFYLACHHDPSTAVLPREDARVHAPDPGAATTSQPPTKVESTVPFTPTRPEPPPSGEVPPDPLAEAEALRALLADAAQRAGQLVQLLKARRRADRAVSQVVRSLRALPLGEGA